MIAAGKQTDHSDGEDDEPAGRDAELLEGIDYYVENGSLVFTAAFLRKRGYCCESDRRHCPYQQHEHLDGLAAK